MRPWYRRYAGTASDVRLQEAAMVAACSRALVIAVWDCLLESACEAGEGGVPSVTARRIAVLLAEPVSTIEGALAALAEAGMVFDGIVIGGAAREGGSDFE